MTGSLPFWNHLISLVIPRKPGRIGLIAIYLVFTAVVARTFSIDMTGSTLVRYLGLELFYLMLFSLVLWKSHLPHGLIYLYFGVQCALVLWLLSLQPDFDFVIVLFFLLSFQAAVFFTSRICWAWVFVFVLLTCGSLIFYHGFFQGLALALTTMAADIVVPAYLLVNQETEAAKLASQTMLKDLGETNQQLQQYVTQVENLAAIQERNHLARTLHDSVSQMMFSISLTSQAALSLLGKDPPRAREEITRLQSMTAEALKQLRSLITEMRPREK
jgi:signal transduction histidine kinase